MSEIGNEKILRRAEFNADVRKYWLLSGVWILFVSVVGIPLIVIWWIIGLWATQRYLDRIECILTERSLIVRKGILNRVEKTVPLDKITDLGRIQGPIMRYFGIDKITVETAGQSALGALIGLYGIKDSDSFRDDVLRQRDITTSTEPVVLPERTASVPDETHRVLVDIRDLLSRIEASISRRNDGDA